MKIRTVSTVLAAAFSIICCTDKEPLPDSETQKPDSGFTESIPDTTRFTNAEFIYNGDDVGEAISDGWLIKLFTDMEIDDAGSPIGPGTVMQILLNVPYDENQSADPSFLKGNYSEMTNSGNFSPYTFVNGYMTAIDLPGERLEIADATFYADIEAGSTEMDYDLLDEGVISISANDDGTYSIEGILVGKKYTKRYFQWTGEAEPKNNVPVSIPNSTLDHDLTNLDFTTAKIVDKGDSFYLKDESYRCILLFLGDETLDMTYDRPSGSGRVLRLEMLVPWDTDILKDGIPEGRYEMVNRNPDTSIDKDEIRPGVAVPGLPDVFAEWKMSGSWYYELTDGKWTDNYARIDGGIITVEKGEDGTQIISYELTDCQDVPMRISGSSTIMAYNDDIDKPDDKPENRPATKDNTFIINGEESSFGSITVSNFGEYICIAACKAEGIDDFDAVFEQDEFLYVAISPLLNGKEFDLITENRLYTVMSTLQGAYLESVAPTTTEEISEGTCSFTYADGHVDVLITVTLADGSFLSAKMSAEETGIIVNENTFTLNGETKPVRTVFHHAEDGLVYLYFTPAGIDYFEELEIVTVYSYIILNSSQCNGHTIEVKDIVETGYVDNLNGISADSRTTKTTGTVNILRNQTDLSYYTVIADLNFNGTTFSLRFEGKASDAMEKEEKKSEVIYDGKSYTIKEAWLDTTPNAEETYTIGILASNDVTIKITVPVKFMDGNAHGFSQSPYIKVTYADVEYSKATGYSGTLTVGITGENLYVEFTNYDNLKFIYEGAFTKKENKQ